MTRRDLVGIHDVLRDNHPGPLDANNPRYRQWLEDGLTKAQENAGNAASFADYIRSLQLYTNGFQDDHIGIGLNVDIQRQTWPGFAVKGTSAQDTQLVHAEANSGVERGARLIACDGRGLDDLLADRVDPYFWNAAIPHQRYEHVNELFHQDTKDPRPRLKTCTFSSGEVVLHWHSASASELEKTLTSALAGEAVPLRIAQINGVWMISIPTFAYSSEAEVAKIKSFVTELGQKAPTLRKTTVVFDVRGDGGGDSAWGDQIAAAFWGEPLLAYIKDNMDDAANWRVSAANLKMVEYDLKRSQAAGLQDATDEWTKIRDGMRAAMKGGQPFVQAGSVARKKMAKRPDNPVVGRVYFLTDGACKSACLDFADIVTRMPNVTHIGLPTAADAIYIDNTFVDLPSRLSGIGYSMKVYRNRARKNNQWYEPKIRWPGGAMTDDAVSRWIATLH